MAYSLFQEAKDCLRQTVDAGSDPNMELSITTFLTSVLGLSEDPEASDTSSEANSSDRNDTLPVADAASAEANETGQPESTNTIPTTDINVTVRHNDEENEEGDVDENLCLACCKDPHPMAWVVAMLGLQEHVIEAIARKPESLIDAEAGTEIHTAFQIHLLGVKAKEILANIVQGIDDDLTNLDGALERYMDNLDQIAFAMEAHRHGDMAREEAQEFVIKMLVGTRDDLEVVADAFEARFSTLVAMLTQVSAMILRLRATLRKLNTRSLVALDENAVDAIEHVTSKAFEGAYAFTRALMDDLEWLQDGGAVICPWEGPEGSITADRIAHAMQRSFTIFGGFDDILHKHELCSQVLQKLNEEWNDFRAGEENSSIDVSLTE